MASVLLPAGVSIISAALKQSGFQCQLFDTTHYAPKEEAQEIKKDTITFEKILFAVFLKI